MSAALAVCDCLRRLLPAFAFDDFDVSVRGEVREPVNLAARPSYLDGVNLRRGAEAEYLARVVRREVAPAARLKAAALHAARLPCDDRADRRRVALRRDELKPEPVSAVAALVA